MTPITVIKQRNEKDFELAILRSEVEQLKREREHLITKAQERPLTIWEKVRCDELLDELFNIFSQIADATAKIKGIHWPRP